MILEIALPQCHHWSVGLANYYWEAIEYASRQSSINGHQAVIDTDGVFRAVISHIDPGVPNWLDTTGLREGSMIYRWNQADGAPIPAAQVVKLADLRTLLPPETRTVTAQERAATIERRREAVRRRYGRPVR